VELPDGFLLGGIQVNEPDMGQWHQALLESSFNTLSLTVYARQHRWDKAEIVFDPDQLGGAMVREIRAAKRAGLNVVLILRVGLEHELATKGTKKSRFGIKNSCNRSQNPAQPGHGSRLGGGWPVKWA
jgi:hypothetical protein